MGPHTSVLKLQNSVLKPEALEPNSVTSEVNYKVSKFSYEALELRSEASELSSDVWPGGMRVALE